MKQITLNDIIDTYKCLISCRDTLPGMPIEEAFSYDAMVSVKAELVWLKELQAINNVATTDESAK